jgi:peroxiredoxin
MILNTPVGVLSEGWKKKAQLAALLSLAACAGSGNPAKSDRDDDGLTDEDEAWLGSNPDDADTDNDGYDDGVEVSSNTDPINGFDRPYAGGWPIGDCRDDIVATGNSVGAVAEDFSLMDQNLEGVRLHDFCDRVVVMASAAVWCAPCQAEASQLQSLFTQYGSDRLMVINLLGEDADSRTPSAEVLNEWVDERGLTYPVLQDSGFSISKRFTGLSAALPATHIIDRGMVVAQTNAMELDLELIESLVEQ